VIVFKQLFSGPIVRSHSGPHFYSPLVAHVHRYRGDLAIERGCPPSKGQGHTFESCRVHLRYFTPRFPRATPQPPIVRQDLRSTRRQGRARPLETDLGIGAAVSDSFKPRHNERPQPLPAPTSRSIVPGCLHD